jgi:hypothetical protein
MEEINNQIPHLHHKYKKIKRGNRYVDIYGKGMAIGYNKTHLKIYLKYQKIYTGQTV